MTVVQCNADVCVSCSIFARGTKNIKEKLDRVGRSQDLPDAR